MAEHPTIKAFYALQSGGYPTEQLLVIERDEGGQKAPIVCAFFADAEMDVFMVEYGPEEEIILHAADVTHITTAPFQLEQISNLYAPAQSLIDELRDYFDDEAGEWSGHEHLITRPNPT